MESIPEWKRNALVVTDKPKEEEKKRGMFGRAKDAMGAKISETEAYQKFKESDDYKELQNKRKEF